MNLPFLKKKPISGVALNGLEIGAIVYNEGVYHTFALSKDRRMVIEFVSVELKNFTFKSVVLNSLFELTLPTAIVRANKIYLFFNQGGSVKLTVCGKDGEWIQHPEPVLRRVGKVDVKIARTDGEYHLVTVDGKGKIKDYKSQNTLQWVLDESLLNGVTIDGARSANIISANGNKYLIYGKGNSTKYALIENGKLKKSADLDDLLLPRMSVLLDGRTLLIGNKNGATIVKEVFMNDDVGLRQIREYDTQKESDWTLDGIFVDKKGYLPDFKTNKEYLLNVNFGSATEFYLKLYSRNSQEAYIYVSKDNGVVVCNASGIKGDGYSSRFAEFGDSILLSYYQEGNILFVFAMGKTFTVTLPCGVQGDTLIKSNGTLNCAIQVNDINKEIL